MKIKVLIVEDEAILAMMYRKSLENKDFAVTAIVASGEEAVEEVEIRRPDVIIIDIMLSGVIDGIEAAEIIRKKHKIPFIYVTSNNDESTRLRAMKTSPVSFLVKPLNMDQIKAVIDNAVIV